MGENQNVMDEQMQEQAAQQMQGQQMQEQQMPEQMTVQQMQEQQMQEQGQQAMPPEAQFGSQIQALTAQMQALAQQNQQMQEQNRYLQSLVSEVSKKNEQTIVEETMEYPTLDLSGLMYADADTVAQKQREFSERMAAYTEQMALKKIEPFIRQAETLAQRNARNEAIAELSSVSQMPDFQQLLPHIEQIIANNSILSNHPDARERYVTAYAIAKGIGSMNQPSITTDKFLEMYNKNPEFQTAVEKQRIAALQKSANVPPLSPGGSVGNASLNISDTPKNFDQARNMMAKLFGV